MMGPIVIQDTQKAEIGRTADQGQLLSKNKRPYLKNNPRTEKKKKAFLHFQGLPSTNKAGCVSLATALSSHVVLYSYAVLTSFSRSSSVLNLVCSST
jgi:hypothetical protein